MPLQPAIAFLKSTGPLENRIGFRFHIELNVIYCHWIEGMNENRSRDPIVFVQRVNRSWIVRHGLAERAEEWLQYLEQTDLQRFSKACRMAQEMCRRRERSEDPKPWFYAGLFSTATETEARQFLKNHRLTPAAVPAMWQDEAVQKWMLEICPVTQHLLQRLRQNLQSLE